MAKLVIEGFGPVDVPDEVQSWPKASVDAFVAQYVKKNKPVALSDVPKMAMENLPESAAQYGSDMVQPFIHPIDTAKGIAKVAAGGIQKLIPGEQSYEPFADAVGQFFSDRYGGWENVKRTMANDPVGFLGDISTVLSGGGTLAARGPGVVGKVGKVAKTAGDVVDPVSIAGKVVKPVAEFLGASTGTNGEAVSRAAQAGYKGGDAADAFTSNMRGTAPVTDVVSDAKTALGNIRQARSTAYVTEMDKLGKRPEVLDFTKADTALGKAIGDYGYKGRFPPALTELRTKVENVLDEWRNLDPATYHTPAGFDALKKELWALQSEYKLGTAQYSFIQDVRKAVEGQIKSQAPEYSKIMRDYRAASETIDELERSLSLGHKSTTDTALRKLQTIMRNNANTNYGARVNMGELLAQSGAPNIMEALAGQSMSAWAPRGISRAGVPAIAGGAYAINPALAAALPLQSPRLVGESAYLLGSIFGRGRDVVNATGLPRLEVSPRAGALGAFQAGRLEDIQDR